MTETLNPVLDAQERLSGVCPSSEELRMLRAIASFAVSEAIVRGASHASFRGFRVNTVRLQREHDKRALVRVELLVSLDGHIVDRESVEIFPSHGI